MNAPATVELAATYLALRDIGPWLEGLLAPLGSKRLAELKGSIELAVHELAANSVAHAYADDCKLVLTGSLEQDRLVVCLEDGGDEFSPDPTAVADPDHPQVGGYGLLIIDALASSVDYERDGDTNRWTVAFDI
jgi:serine/threonine-protein kinase RsbW